MKNEPKPEDLTPEQIAEMQKTRILSDADAIEHGAEVDAEGKILFTEDQKKWAHNRMVIEAEEDLAEKRSELPKHNKENWKKIVSVLGRFNVIKNTYEGGYGYLGFKGDKLVIRVEEPSTGDGGPRMTSYRDVEGQDLEIIRSKFIEDSEKNEAEGKGSDIKKEALEFLEAEIGARNQK